VQALAERCPKGGVLFSRKIGALASPLAQQKLAAALKVASAVAGAALKQSAGNCRAVFHVRNPYDVVVSQFQARIPLRLFVISSLTFYTLLPCHLFPHEKNVFLSLFHWFFVCKQPDEALQIT
jgi:hypothetical protein